MDDTITIRTSDDPPVELKAARAVLVAGSKVFADMLSLPQGASPASLDAYTDVSESADEFRPFLRLLNIAHEEHDPLEDMTAATWLAMVKLADKYDSAGVHTLTSKLEEQSVESVATLKLALALGNQDLIKKLVFRLLLCGRVNCLDMAIQGHEAQLNDEAGPYFENCTKNCKRARVSAWKSAVAQGLQNWSTRHLASPFLVVYRSTYQQQHRRKPCATHRIKSDEEVRSWEQMLRDNAPDFPL
ncbi:hypothetical protein JCM8208_001246 [Rhodotorula glutinis]